MPVDAVKRFGEVAGQGICGGDGAGAGAEGCYGSSMGDDWRVRIAVVDLPRELTDDDQGYAGGTRPVRRRSPLPPLSTPRWSPAGRRLSLTWAAASAIR